MNQIDRLLTIMQRLRDPGSGCPWDREQTFATVAPYALEEVYEVLGAIAHEDFDDLRGELGDLLLQTVFYVRMVQEERHFDFNGICAVISDRLERRHPHVFADSSAENSSEVFAHWEQIKTEECTQRTQHLALDNIPHSLSALMRAQKIQKRCANIDFDWMAFGLVVDKVYEEIGEMIYGTRQAVVSRARPEEEMDDLLFTTVDLARHLGTKVEIALQKTNEKFERRFCEVGRTVAVRGPEIAGVDLETMEEVW